MNVRTSAALVLATALISACDRGPTLDQVKMGSGCFLHKQETGKRIYCGKACTKPEIKTTYRCPGEPDTYNLDTR